MGSLKREDTMDIMMCRPDFFDVKYKLSTNRWMNPKVPPNKALARKQWNDLYESYQRFGINVTVMSAQPDLNDMVFAANAGLPVGKYFILSKFFHHERIPESPLIRKFLSQNYEIKELLGEVTFEGQGDAFFIDDKTLLIGCGIRTSEKAIEELRDIFRGIDPGINIIPLYLRPIKDHTSDEKIFYHLDTCLMYLRKARTFMIYSTAFRDGTVTELKRIGEVVEVSKEDAESFVCNSVDVEDAVFTPKFNSKFLHDLFISSGYAVVEHDMSEFIKSGGAVKCLSLELNL